MQFSDAHDAAFNGSVTQLKKSIANGVPVNEGFETRFSNSCSTLLHVAAQQGHTECLRLLLDTGADPCIADCWGHTAAHLAVLEGYSDALEVIVKSDSQVLQCIDEAERTPLHVAAQVGDVACIMILLQYGDKLLPMTTDSEGVPVPIASPLHLAAAGGHSEALKTLINASNQSLLSSVDSFGRTPLHIAGSNGHTECAQVLLQCGSNVNAKNSWGASPLHLAARCKDSATIGLLLTNGVDIDARDNHGMAALHYASQAGCEFCIKALLDGKADVNSRSSCRETPLTLALANKTSNNCKAASLLLWAGASLDCLQEHYHNVSGAAKKLVQSHVQRTTEAAHSSMNEFLVSHYNSGRSSSLLCNDVVDKILGHLFDVEDDFLRILLGGEGGGPGSLL